MWLSMIRDRLMALRSLLGEDASVWVHLDDAEVHRGRAIMDEVFGENAFVASVVWQKKTTRDSRAAFSTNHDTILVYAPSGPIKWKTSRNLLAKDNARLLNKDNDPRGPWTDAPFTAPGYRDAQQYTSLHQLGRFCVRHEADLGTRRNRPIGPTCRRAHLVPERRRWLASPQTIRPPTPWLVPFTVWGTSDTGTNDDAKRHLMALFPGQRSVRHAQARVAP